MNLLEILLELVEACILISSKLKTQRAQWIAAWMIVGIILILLVRYLLQISL